MSRARRLRQAVGPFCVQSQTVAADSLRSSKNEGITTAGCHHQTGTQSKGEVSMKDKRQKAQVRREAGLWRILKFCLLVSPLCLALFTPSLMLSGEAQSDTGVRADLPFAGELRIEKRRGGVSIEVWNEKQVSV